MNVTERTYEKNASVFLQNEVCRNRNLSSLSRRIKIFLCFSLFFAHQLGSGMATESDNEVAVERQTASRFWKEFSESVLAALTDSENPEVALSIMNRGATLIENNETDAFACQAAIRLATIYFRAGRAEQAKKIARFALKLPETYDGNHIRAWNIIAQSHASLGQFADAIEASEEVLRSDAPDAIKAVLDQQALIRMVEMLLNSPDTEAEDRELADGILAKLLVDDSGLASRYKGQLTRARILNLKEAKNVAKTEEIAIKFVHMHPCDYWAPLIAVDLWKLKGSAGPEPLKLWLDFFEGNDCPPSAALASLKYTLMNAYALERRYSDSVALGKDLLTFTKARNDPVSWTVVHEDSVRSLMAVSNEGIKRANNRSRLAEGNRLSAKNSIIMVAVLFVLAFAPLLFARLGRFAPRKK